MLACILWIDSEHARIFKIDSKGIEKKKITFHGKQPAHSANHDDHKRAIEEHFFKDVLTEIGHDVEEFLIIGAGQYKFHFKNYLEKHNKNLYSKIVGFETLSNVTDNQLLDHGRKFFKKYNTYHSDIESIS